MLYRDIQGKFVDILTEEDYPFGFRQRILRYGSNAQVLEPEWLVKEIGNIFKEGHINYFSI